ncbi:MAG: ABC transporter ATP-binding protein/permease [Turicibacter sp.]|nr:ABC transporter ATP-binding protein/permease [Turicibacter sp.]
MLKIFKYLTAKEWQMGFIALIFIVAQVWLDLAVPEYMAEITMLVQTPGSAISAIWAAGGMMMLATFGSLTATVIIGYFSAIIGSQFARNLRSLLFNRVDSFSMQEINNFSTDSLITRSTNDITQVQILIVMGLMLMIRAPIMIVWAISRIHGGGLEWLLATWAGVGIMTAMIAFIMVFVIPRFRKMQGLIDDMNRVTRENLNGLRVVRAYNAEHYQEEKFKKANDELTGTQLYVTRAMAILFPVINLIMAGITLAIYWIGASMIDAAEISDRLPIFADMVVFSQYAIMAIMSFLMLAMIFIMLPRASVSAKRINEVLETQPTIKNGIKTEGVAGLKGSVVFKNVSFKYPDAADYMLRDINFTANEGETVAFIGSTGSGKTTLVNLIPRFFDVTDGEILFNGVNVRDYSYEFLCNKIGYISQKAILFKGSIKSNVGYGDNGKETYSENDIKKAVEIAQGRDFIEEMENTYEAEIAQAGTNISGGQKQRIAIARAICRKPELYIFDDSFSALDYKTDRELRTALKRENANVTKLIVAQRIGTIIDADKIIVLDEGKIVGMGNHNELLQNCEVYVQIARSQLSDEDLQSFEQ